MNSNDREFQQQLNASIKRNLADFNSNPKLSLLREFYKNNFDQIKTLIKQTSARAAIEDITNADSQFKSITSSTSAFLLLSQINNGIATGSISESDIL